MKKGSRVRQTERILALLEVPRHYREVGDLAGLTYGAAAGTLWRLEQRKLAFVVRWVPPAGRGQPTPIFLAGPHKSAPRPAPMTRAERSQRERDRARAANNFSIDGGQLRLGA